MMHKPCKRVIVLLLTLLLIIGVAAPAFALDEVETRTVRVGYYHTEGYHVLDEDGNRSGYGYEILQAMKLYTNWRYEYIGYDKGWADIQQMMLDGEVDLAVSAIKTPAREEIYDFSDRAIGQSGASLMVKAGESPYVAGLYESYNGMRIGFIENASHIASMESFAADKGFQYTPVYYKTSDELERAILAGKDIDAIVTSNLRIVAGTRRLELFDMRDIHAMVRKGDAALLKEINYALEQISLYNPGLYESLYNKYYSVPAGDAVFFSPDESAFINECQASGEVLSVALVPDMSPYACYEQGEPTGILYDITFEILRRTGLHSELVVAQSDAAYRDLIDSRSVDLLLSVRFDRNYAERIGYKMTDPYYSTDVSRVTRKGHQGAVESVATVKKSIIDTHYLPTVITNEAVVYYDSVADCVKAVLDGSCDAMYLLTRSAQEVVFNDETNRLTSVIMPRFSLGFSLGVRDDVDARLASILQKSADSLREDDVSALVLQYTDYSMQPATLIGLLYNNPVIIIAAAMLLLVLVFGVIMIVFTTRKRRQEQEQNRQLQAALASAEQANAAKSVFMSRMSHEIRTPLNAIIGYNSISGNRLAEAKNETDYRQAAMKAMDCLSKSEIASKHLLTVINDVLDMSAIESGKIKIAREPFDFREMVSALTLMFFSQAKAKEIGFEVLFHSPTEEWFIGDQMRINQVLTNLLSNAVKFTSVGGSVCLSIGQTVLDEESTRIRFGITDTGIGMSEEFLRNIWTPFEQADASISRRFGGTGLGLSITKSLVDLMGGTISVESEEGAGSNFQVEITLERMAQPVRNSGYDFSDINVLIVDDDQSTCDYLRLLFSRLSVRCAAVTTGQEAIDAVAAAAEAGQRYTLCIIDWHMPGMDGLETVRKIRELAGSELPIIIISAYDYAEIEDDARAIGVESFIAKPLFQSSVFDLLANICGRRGVAINIKTTKHDFGGERVLLAEDNKMNMEIAKAILASWNLTVDSAWNGREAVAMFCSAPPGTYKAILMDVHMPEIDGYRATQIIRASDHDEATSIPIIAMTADVFAEDVAEALASGMNDHIGKPIEQGVLLETLIRHIGL